MGSQLVPRLLAGHTNNARYRTLVRVDGQNCSLALIFIGTFPRPLPARAGARLSKQGADSRRYKDHRSGQQQSTDDLFVQGAAAMIAARIVFGRSHSSYPKWSRAHPSNLADHPAMAAGVSDTLWSLTDMVRVIEDWEAAGSAKISGTTLVG